MITAQALARDEKPGFGDNAVSTPSVLMGVTDDDQMRAQFRGANWIKPLLDPKARKALVRYSAMRIADKAINGLGALAFTGLSGSIIAGPLATELELYLYAVRKPGESKHSDFEVEGLSSGCAKHYLIVDDFYNTGNTVRRIAQQVSHHTNHMAKCVGVYFWRDDEFYFGEHLERLLENTSWTRTGRDSLTMVTQVAALLAEPPADDIPF